MPTSPCVGMRIRDVVDIQLPKATGNAAGPHHGLRRHERRDPPGARIRSHAWPNSNDLHDRLSHSGATVVTTTFPDIARILPAGRLLASRVIEVNEIDQDPPPTVTVSASSTSTTYRRWPSRTPGAPIGSTVPPRVTCCSRPRPAEALGLPGSNHDWHRPALAADGRH